LRPFFFSEQIVLQANTLSSLSYLSFGTLPCGPAGHTLFVGLGPVSPLLTAEGIVAPQKESSRSGVFLLWVWTSFILEENALLCPPVFLRGVRRVPSMSLSCRNSRGLGLVGGCALKEYGSPGGSFEKGIGYSADDGNAVSTERKGNYQGTRGRGTLRKGRFAGAYRGVGRKSLSPRRYMGQIREPCVKLGMLWSLHQTRSMCGL